MRINILPREAKPGDVLVDFTAHLQEPMVVRVVDNQPVNYEAGKTLIGWEHPYRMTVHSNNSYDRLIFDRPE